MQQQKNFDRMLKQAMREGKQKQAEGKQSSWRNSQEKKARRRCAPS